jgi:dihydrofolate synthase/folylpolyglutamate synthase
VAVIEAGLGGRYDATNVVPSKVQVLTNVGLEHTRWLGPTIEHIAREKLAVVRDHATLVTPAELDPGVESVARRAHVGRHADWVRAQVQPGAGLRLGSPGAFQRGNFALAAAAAKAFLGRPLEAAELGRAAAETRVPGRLEVVGDRPLTVFDAAHNPSGAAALVEALPEVIDESRPRVAVISVLEDKDAAAMLAALLPRFERVVFTRCANPRALSPATLESLARQLEGSPSETVANPRAALERARTLAGPGGAVVATGSIYLIADLVRSRSGARASTL